MPDVPAYRVTRNDGSVKRIAIIGAGLSGLVLARRLGGVADITLFEKSRGVGGRIATRYAGEFEFDHGAQFFTARTREFRAFLQPLIDDHVIANWTARFAEFNRERLTDLRAWGEDYPHFVGTPRMNAIGKYLSQGLEIRTNTRVVDVERENDRWTLADSAGNSYEEFDWLVLTAPAPQTAQLAAGFPDLVAQCEQREMLACYALMLGFTSPLDLPWQAALVRRADISWISVNSSKPGRKPSITLLVHSTNAWANAHVDADRDAVREHILNEASAIVGTDLRLAEHCELHLWRYANIDRQSGPDFYINNKTRLAACGDWFMRGRVEAAFTSANALAAELKERA